MFGLNRPNTPMSKDEVTAKNTKKMSQLQRRILLVVAAFLLLVVAVALLLVRTAAGTSGLQGCQGIVFSAQKYSCYSNLAAQTKNYSICALVRPSSGADACISSIAESEHNVSMCEKINSTSPEYEGCIENVTFADNNVNYCLLLKGRNESSCAYTVAQNNQFSNKSYCGAINNSSIQNICNYTYYYQFAKTSRQPTYCSYLPSGTNTSVITSMLLTDSNQSLLGSGYLPYSALNVTPQGLCYYKVALLLNDKNYCSYVNGVLSQICNQSFSNSVNLNISNLSTNSNSIAQNFTAYCGSFPEQFQPICIFGLYTSMALKNGSVSYCLAISNITYQYSCITQLASRYNQSSYCDYITNNVSTQQACLGSIGLNLNGTH